MCDLGILDGVERLEVEQFNFGTNTCISQCSNDGHVDGVLILRTRGVSGKVSLDSAAVDGEQVGGQSSEHGIVTPANSSMAVMRVTMALYLANC